MKRAYVLKIYWKIFLRYDCAVDWQFSWTNSPYIDIQPLNDHSCEYNQTQALMTEAAERIMDFSLERQKFVHTSKAWEKSRHFATPALGFPAKWRLRNERKSFILMKGHYPDMVSASDWSWLEALTRSRYWRVISMEFVPSFLRRHFAGKPVVASRNDDGHFLRLFLVRPCAKEYQWLRWWNT